MEKYTTTCGVELPEVDPEKNFPLVFYKVTEDWSEFLRHTNGEPIEEHRALINNVAVTDEDFRKKIAQAACTMYWSGGIGIAANQIGFKENWFILDTKWTESGVKKPRVVINPKLSESYLVEGTRVSHEGCLSVPLGFKGNVNRHAGLRLEYTNLSGFTETWDAFDLDAFAVMHEVDHLQGRMFIDYQSKLRLGMLEKKIKKVKKSVQHRIENHNRSIMAQVKKFNTIAPWAKETPPPVEVKEHDEPLVVITDEQVPDIAG